MTETELRAGWKQLPTNSRGKLFWKFTLQVSQLHRMFAVEAL